MPALLDDMPIPSSVHSEPLAPVCRLWCSLAKSAAEYKKEVFQDAADEVMKFYGGDHAFMYETGYVRKSGGIGKDSDIVPPLFRATANLSFEAVSLLGPTIYSRNPVCKVTPRTPIDIPQEIIGLWGNDPMAMQQIMMMGQQAQSTKMIDFVRAQLVERVVNYFPNEFDLKGEAKKSVNEAILKGRGVLRIDLFQPEGVDTNYVLAEHETVDRWYLDPDCEAPKDARFAIRKVTQPTWLAERRFGLEPGSLKGNAESRTQQAASDLDRNGTWKRKRGETVDQITYYEIYSRMGMGGRAKNTPVGEMREALELFGDNVYIVVAEGVSYPLNIPPALMDAPMTPEVEQLLMQAVQWPTPFWRDPADPWPFVNIDFHPGIRCPYPLAHLGPALAYQRALNWIYSSQISKVYTSSRDIYLADKQTEEELLGALQNGEDRVIVPVHKQPGQKMTDYIEVLQHPQMHPDMWSVGAKMEQLFQRSTGMNDVLYGQTPRQERSATESQRNAEMTNIRPGDMANVVEDAMTLVFRKVAIAARVHLRGKDVEPILGLGPLGAMLWDQLVVNVDPDYIVREFEYRIEAGSIRKPNQELDLQNANDGAQFVFPHLVGVYNALGVAGPANAFLRYWGKSRQMDMTEFMLPDVSLPPAAMQGVVEQQAAPKEEKAA